MWGNDTHLGAGPNYPPDMVIKASRGVFFDQSVVK